MPYVMEIIMVAGVRMIVVMRMVSIITKYITLAVAVLLLCAYGCGSTRIIIGVIIMIVGLVIFIIIIMFVANMNSTSLVPVSSITMSINITIDVFMVV